MASSDPGNVVAVVEAVAVAVVFAHGGDGGCDVLVAMLWRWW